MLDEGREDAGGREDEGKVEVWDGRVVEEEGRELEDGRFEAGGKTEEEGRTVRA